MVMNLNLIKDIAGYLIDNSQNFSFEKWEEYKSKIEDDLKKVIKELYINNRLKQKHPVLSFFSKIPLVGKMFNKKIKNKKNIYIEEFENNPKIEGFRDIKKFTNFIENEYFIECDKELKDINYRKLELIMYLNRIQLLLRKKTILADNMYEHYMFYKEYSDIQITFREDELKEFLKNKNTTKKDIEKILSLFKSKIDPKFLENQLNNLDKIKEEQENLPEKEKDYNLYANILHLKAILYYNLYDDKEEYTNEARELFNAEKFYRNLNFCLKEENIFNFIKENCLDPRILYEKVKKLNDSSQKYNENTEDTFYVLLNNLNNIEKEIDKKNISKEIIAGLKFFKGAVLELMGSEKTRKLKHKNEYFKAIKNYNYIINSNNFSEENKDKLEKTKIACLATINILNKATIITDREVEAKKNDRINETEENKNPFIKHFNIIINNISNIKEKINSLLNKNSNENYNIEQEVNTADLYNSLSESCNQNAQYECGVFQEKLDSERAINHFENAAINGHNKSKLKTIKYYLKNSKNRNEYIEREILNSDIPYKTCEKIAKVYKKNNEYEKAIEFYNKVNEKLKNKEKVKDNFSKISNTFIKIGNCFTKLGDKFKKLAKINKNDEQKKLINDYYTNAIDNYENSENSGKKWFPTLKSMWKIADTHRKNNNFKEYKTYLNILSLKVKDLQIENIEKKTESEKKYLKRIFSDLANFYSYGLFKDKYKKYIDYKKALEYYEKAANLGDVDSMYEAGYLLKTGTYDYSVSKNEKKALEYFKKIVNLCQDTKQNEAAIEIAKLFLTNSEIKEQNRDEISKLFENLKDPKTKFDIAKMFKQKGEFLEESEAIKIFKNLAESSEDYDIAIKSLFELGDIYSKRDNEEDLKYSSNCYFSIANSNRNMSNEELEEVSNKIKYITIKLNAIELENKVKKIEFAKAISSVDGRETEAIKIFEELKNCENTAIKFDALLGLGDIYCKKNNIKDLKYAKNCYIDAIDTNPTQIDERNIIYDKISEIDEKINNPNFIKINIQNKLLNCINDINEHFQNILPKKKDCSNEDTMKEGYIIDDNGCIILLP